MQFVHWAWSATTSVWEGIGDYATSVLRKRWPSRKAFSVGVPHKKRSHGGSLGVDPLIVNYSSRCLPSMYSLIPFRCIPIVDVACNDCTDIGLLPCDNTSTMLSCSITKILNTDPDVAAAHRCQYWLKPFEWHANDTQRQDARYDGGVWGWASVSIYSLNGGIGGWQTLMATTSPKDNLCMHFRRLHDDHNGTVFSRRHWYWQWYTRPSCDTIQNGGAHPRPPPHSLSHTRRLSLYNKCFCILIVVIFTVVVRSINLLLTTTIRQLYTTIQRLPTVASLVC